ncbi:alpha/beta hydrolase fold [Nesidiocoris tenuis]|uniref:Alpha/beta hydrolase fold n=2 Tax=Nesidiocoris tenuis TaxID=355587 RepID=A0ABN7AET7_9HEMI|nr:alpha/beta hydrolase fold [Nesidiocoris tenuis]
MAKRLSSAASVFSIVAVVFQVVVVRCDDTVTVDVPGLGRLTGSLNVSLWSERTIYQFYGIPYAQPPSGDLRFKEPVKATPWEGVLDATKFRRRCPQALFEEDMLEISKIQATEDLEDCLFLNVFTTLKPTQCSKRYPVMFWIHGGSFRVGSAHGFRPNHLLERDVVLVTIQYRLGPFGFLSLQDEHISGNMGLLDMLMALEWTQEHIDQFCGDPKQITIFGQSSGGSAVSLMLASPLTKGRFQRAIVQSGGSLCDWTMDHKAENHAVEIAAVVKCNGTHSEIYECLKRVSVYDILNAHSTFTVIDKSDAIAKYHQVTVNGGNHAVVQVAGNQKFLTEDPKKIFEEGRYHKVPTMVGFTKHEGTLILGNIYDFILGRNLSQGSALINNGFTQAALKFSGIKDPSGAIADVFNEHYFERSQVGNFTEMVPGLVDICGLLLLKSCIFLQAKRTYNITDTYLYTFNYQGHITKWGYGQGLSYPFPGGVAHSDDLVYLFPDDKGNLTLQERAMAKTMVEMWTNFAITGKPAPATGIDDWPKMSHPYGPYLRIKAHPEIRDNILDEYTITIKEGLHDYSNEIAMQDEDSNAAIAPSNVAMLVAVSLSTLVIIYNNLEEHSMKRGTPELQSINPCRVFMSLVFKPLDAT